MYPAVEQIAKDTGMEIEDANFIFTRILVHLCNKIPAFTQVIEDVFANAEPEKLKDHIRKMIVRLQQQVSKEEFKSWQMPAPQDIKRQEGCDRLF